MPNPWHLLLWSRSNGALSDMQWMTVLTRSAGMLTGMHLGPVRFIRSIQIVAGSNRRAFSNSREIC